MQAQPFPPNFELVSLSQGEAGMIVPFRGVQVGVSKQTLATHFGRQCVISTDTSVFPQISASGFLQSYSSQRLETNLSEIRMSTKITPVQPIRFFCDKDLWRAAHAHAVRDENVS